MDENRISTIQEGVNATLANLEMLRDKLEESNRVSGALTRFEAMKKEIQEIGWNGILAKYHPDINIDDPAAFPLFEMYRFAYNALEQGR